MSDGGDDGPAVPFTLALIAVVSLQLGHWLAQRKRAALAVAGGCGKPPIAYCLTD